jgi:hypothetical protein
MARKDRNVNLNRLIKVDVNRLCCDGDYSNQIGRFHLTLEHTERGIELIVNNVRQPIVFPIYERPLRGRLWRGGKIPWDKSVVYLASGLLDHRRCRHLYIDPVSYSIGTRWDFRPAHTYDSRCLSQKNRKIFQECNLMRLTRRERRRQIELRKQRKENKRLSRLD